MPQRLRAAYGKAARNARPPFALAARLPDLAYTAVANRDCLPGRVRDLLVALGPAYVKLGQVLSTRVDVLPAGWITELAALRDRMPPESPAAVTAVLARAFPAGVHLQLVDVSPHPVAAGTVAQVHTARLPSGQQVAVKVLRPGVQEQLEANFALLLGLARVAQRLSRRARVLNVREVVVELRELLLSQTDLEDEARNYRRFAREFADDDTVRLPKVFPSLCSREVLVTEFVEGVDPYQTDRLAEEPRALAKRVDDLVDAMIFVKGLCHADLHPGNFFWGPDGRIVLVDLGLVHRLSKEERGHLLAFYSAILDGFNEFAAEYVLRHLTMVAGAPPDGSDIPAAAYEDMARAVRKHWVESHGRPSFAAMFVDLLGVLGRHGLQLRQHYSRLFLTLATVEGYLFSLDPTFEPLENARRKRVEQAEYVTIPSAAQDLVLEGFATYSTAMFGGGADPRKAYANRDEFVLDSLDVRPGTVFLDVGCGRGQLLAAAAQRGATVLGITISEDEYRACTARGVDVVLSSWEDADHHQAVEARAFDAIAAVEMDVHLATLHENRVGLLDLRLEHFFAWARSHLRPDGKLFVQTLSVPTQLLHDPALAVEYERLTDDLPWLGFSTLAQMIRCSDPYFAVDQVLDHSGDLLPTFRFWRDNINRQLSALRGVVRDETVVLVRRQLDTMIGLAERERLSLYRILLRARPTSA